MNMKIIVPLLVIAAVVVVALLLRQRRTGTVSIVSPRFGILNLKGAAAEPLISEDMTALAPVLGQPNRSMDATPQCDVLLLYCDIDRSGTVRNAKVGFREIIRDSGATIVVVASENDADAYIAAGKDKGFGRANLVMTLQRNGDVFASFFARLFADMKRGVSMPVAWVKLAPQIPGHEHSDCPGTIFACEAGQVTFK